MSIPGLVVLKRRADYLAAQRGQPQHRTGFTLRARRRGGDDIRVGFTCSKKVGNAVARNRAKRRLREAARIVLPKHGQPGWDYVLIGRAEVTANRSYDALLSDLRYALRKVHAQGK